MSQDTAHLPGVDRRLTDDGVLDTLTAPAAYNVSVSLGTVSEKGVPQYQECTLLLSKGTTILRKNGPYRHVFHHSSLEGTRTAEDPSQYNNKGYSEQHWPEGDKGWFGTQGFVIDDSKADEKASWYLNFIPRGSETSSYDLGPRMDFTDGYVEQKGRDAEALDAWRGIMTQEQGTSTGCIFTPAELARQ